MDQNAILEKIRKLLAKAENPACTPQEAEAFNAKAAELLARYGIEQSMLAAENPDAQVIGDKVIRCAPEWAREKAILLHNIADVLGVRTVRITLTPGMGFDMHLFGTVADIERVEVLYTSLLVQQARFLARERVPYGVNPKVFRRSWLRHYAQEIWTMLTEREAYARKQAEGGDAGSSLALVLVTKADKIERRMAEVYPKRRKTRHLINGVGRSGRDAARQSDLGGARVGRVRGAIGG